MPLLVEAGWGGVVTLPATITWTDITQYVDVGQGVSVTRGASDELSETQPGTATLVLDNADGRFTPGNTTSPFYPFVRRNAPIRIAAAVIPAQPTGSGPWSMTQLGDDFDARTHNIALWPNLYSGAVQTGGRMRVPMAPGVVGGVQSARNWVFTGSSLTAKLAVLPAAGGSSAGSASLFVSSTTSGTRIGWKHLPTTGQLQAFNEVSFSDGSAVSIPYSAIDHVWVRVRETAGTVRWETSGDGYTWTTVRTLATPAWVGAQVQMVEMTGTRTGGVTDYIEWDLLGADVRPRFWGVVNEFPVTWEGLNSTVSISCTDLFKQLNKLPALRSMVGQEILELVPLVYYPLTEDETSLSAGDVSGTGAPSLAITQAGAAGSGTLTLGSSEGPPETGEQVATFTPVSATAGKYLTNDMGPAVGARMYDYLCMEAWFQTTTTGRCIMGIHSTTLAYQHLLSIAPGGGLQIEWTWDGTALTTEAISGPTNLANGAWHHVVYDQYNVAVWIDGVLADSSLAVPRTWEERVLHVGGYRGTRLWNGSIGHAAIYSNPHPEAADIAPAALTHYTAGMTGYAGEDADVRVQRLARYAGLDSVTVWGATHDPVASQGPGGSSVMARMREIETTESGRLFAERDYYGLAYQSRDIRYNPSPAAETFTIAYADLEPGIELADDDQKLVNQVEATRPGGATQRVSASESVLAFGLYPQDLNVLKTSDNSVLDAAAWLVSRYANPQPELREVPIEAYTMGTYLDILDAEIGSYFSVTALPAQATAPTMRVTVEGYTETIKHNSHVIAFHTSASSTDSVWVLDDAVYSVLGSTTRLAY